MMVEFKDLDAMDLKAARSELDFPVRRETAISEVGHLNTAKDVVIHDTTEEILGLVSKKKPQVPYVDIMDWLTQELDQTGVDYKLRDMTLDKKYNFHQEFVLDHNIPGPDGNSLSPLVFVKGSYIGAPMVMEFGTFRYTCANGAKVGEIIEDIKISAREAKDLSTRTIRDEIKLAIDRFNIVNDKYTKLSQEDWNPYLEAFMTSELIPIMVRKKVLELLAEQGDVQVTVDKLKSKDLKEATTELYDVLSAKTAFDLYNVATQIVTHSVRGMSGQKKKFDQISEFFGV